ncbi:MAG: hypothetical protein ACLPX9_10815 [Rhodomicrobium sp.]
MALLSPAMMPTEGVFRAVQSNFSGLLLTKLLVEMTYRTVFDVSELAPPVLWPLMGVALSAIAVFIVFIPNKYWNTAEEYGLVFPGRRYLRAVALLVLIGSAISAVWLTYEYVRMKYMIVHGHYNVVEGIVENFRPMPFSGHSVESFDVNGVHFSYSDYKFSQGFNNTSSHGGPIRQGLHVKIAYMGNTIIKLEIAE